MQKIINKITGEIIVIKKIVDIEKIVQIERFATKYSEPQIENLVFPILPTVHELAKIRVREQILADENYSDFEKFEDFNDWLHTDRQYRIVANQKQRDTIADEHPEFLVSLNVEKKNPKVEIGDKWEVYVSTFLPGAREYLESLEVLIEERPEIITP